MSKFSRQTRSFIVLFGLAIVGSYLCVMLWPDLASFTYKIHTDDKSSTAQNVGNPTVEDPAVPTVDTSTWKEYSNTDYGFSFKYNPDWKILSLTSDNDFKILQIDPGKKFYNIKIYISSKEFYVMEGLPTKTETIDGKETLNVSNLLYGIKTDKYYYTFDIGYSLSLTPDFVALVHSVKFQ